MLDRLVFHVIRFVIRQPKWLIYGLLGLIVGVPIAGIIGANIYQEMDRDRSRGAVAIADGAYGESYSVPEYLEQGWSKADSLWFYNTTQGSALLPYDFLLVLEQPGMQQVTCDRNGATAAWFLCDKNVDRFRYLPQKKTLFNPDALPVGLVKEPYQGKDYVGFTCAACHTGQVNYRGRAIRIDGGPAMADMAGFLTELERALKLTRGRIETDKPRLERFVERVLALDNDYDDRAQVLNDLEKWIEVLILYNTVNAPTYLETDAETKDKVRKEVKYGHARLDAFGRIYNRVIQHAINKDQVKSELGVLSDDSGTPLLSEAEIDSVVEGTGDLILRDDDFYKIVQRLVDLSTRVSSGNRDLLALARDQIFNSPNAPVSYPFLWDIAHSDYVQWNALASNAGPGPIGRNAGEVIGVFGILDWQEDKRWFTRLLGFSLSARLSGQTTKKKQIYFKSSIDLFNLQRLESHVGELKSPKWPFCWDAQKEEYYLPVTLPEDPKDKLVCRGDDKPFDVERLERGKLIYAERCLGCHRPIQRDAWDRLMVGTLSRLSKAGTDPAMARNSVRYMGKSGNFKDTYLKTGVGSAAVLEDTPVVLTLSAATRGVVGTADADKWWPRRIVDYLYALVMTFFDNRIKESIKVGVYDPDTTAEPFKSLLSYRARSLNGIWATAPYLHNGSVPTLYDLLLPAEGSEEAKRGGCTEFRPTTFMVGAREFDPVRVGFRSEGYKGFEFDTSIPGNANTGHDYRACDLSDKDRWSLIEYLKSL